MSLQIMLVDDERIVHESVGRYLQKCGHRVVPAYDGQAALDQLAEQSVDVVFADIRMPRMDGLTFLSRSVAAFPALPVAMITGHADLELAIQAIRGGAFDFICKPIELIALDAVLVRVARLEALLAANQRLQRTVDTLRLARTDARPGGDFLGDSPGAKAVRHAIQQAVDGQCPTVLLTGETGVGKEVAALAIHRRAAVGEAPFIAVSCPAIPPSLLESELFGHVKGTFTGATADRAGCFELAQGGTLLLDEVADLSPAAQAAMLRVLETRCVRRVGGTRECPVDVRVIAASNAQLDDQVRRGRFRADLYYRLAAFAIDIPPLRERREDIPVLAQHFLAAFAQGRKLAANEFSHAGLARLQAYPYPGNVRELRNIVERAAVVCRGNRIDASDLNLAPDAPRGPTLASPGADERTRILAALTATRWNRRQAAANLGMAYSTLRERIARYALLND